MVISSVCFVPTSASGHGSGTGRIPGVLPERHRRAGGGSPPTVNVIRADGREGPCTGQGIGGKDGLRSWTMGQDSPGARDTTMRVELVLQVSLRCEFKYAGICRSPFLGLRDRVCVTPSPVQLPGRHSMIQEYERKDESGARIPNVSEIAVGRLGGQALAPPDRSRTGDLTKLRLGRIWPSRLRESMKTRQ